MIVITIKRYKNRRLYNTEQSKYITKDELLLLIRDGHNVQVQNAADGHDITAETLLSLFIDDVGPTKHFIPLDFLHFLIRSNESVLTTFFKDFLPQAMQMFGNFMGQTPFQPQSLWQHFNPFNLMANPFSAKLWAPPAKPENKPDQMEQKINALQAQLDQLKKQR